MSALFSWRLLLTRKFKLHFTRGEQRETKNKFLLYLPEKQCSPIFSCAVNNKINLYLSIPVFLIILKINLIRIYFFHKCSVYLYNLFLMLVNIFWQIGICYGCKRSPYTGKTVREISRILLHFKINCYTVLLILLGETVM